ncbi:class III extradiol ring-cleavage dioxygenase [Aquipuribacter hungaricus]|uniref:Dioxygenase n=1 Tax=Aquipuribacter hungaricus TaxID=545624 RepID=A0ABV7WIT8_9MICO
MEDTVDQTADRMPSLYLGHGAPVLLDDARWTAELAAWSATLPRPRAVLIVSAHWEQAPLSLSATAPGTELVHDYSGFDPKFGRMRYDTPDATALADAVEAMLPDGQTVHRHARRGLDHGAWVPLRVMYPDADLPTLQLSMPTLDPRTLMALGRRLAPLRDEGVLVVGSGFLTHGLPFLTDWRPDATPPGWSAEFDAWAAEALAAGDVDSLLDFRTRAPGMPYAHPTVEHMAPLFVTLGAAQEADGPVETAVDGFFLGLSKRSFQVA